MRSLLGALLALAAAAASAGASSFRVSVDPRFELLAVVQQLAGLSRADESTASYRERIDRRFAPFRDHPAVGLYRELGRDRDREEACATILIYFSTPPALALQDKEADIHYIKGEGETEEMHRFLWELRDFARASDFTAFFKENAEYYAGVESEARSSLAGVDPAAALESFLGVSLNTEAHHVVSLLAPRERAFIVPYPLPPANLGTKSFQAYTISPDRQLVASLWSESLYVFVDPSFYYFEKRIPDPAAFFGPEISRCRAKAPDCAKMLLTDAIILRMERRRHSMGSISEYDQMSRRYLTALSERLAEYEAARDRYPTLWSFYPRLLSVFHELAHDGKPAELPVPAEPPIRSAADFFDPAIVGRLKR